MPVTITTPNISKAEFTELVSDLLEDIVHGDVSPLKDATEVFTDYLETSTDLDNTQKAGALSSFLKETYAQINQQVLGTALDLLKTNEQFKLDKYIAEGKYNSELAQQAISAEELLLKAAETAIKERELDLLETKIDNENAKILEMLAKLKKQYGYGDAVLNPPSTFNANTDLGTSTDDGALDKQITGYDKLNLKDVLKTMDEKAALMQNAKVPETLHEKAARIELIAEISKHDSGTLTYKLVDGSNTYIYSPNINDAIPFNGTWSPALP